MDRIGFERSLIRAKIPEKIKSGSGNQNENRKGGTMTKKITDIRSKMTLNWIEKGRVVLNSMTEQDQGTIIAFVSTLILEDVKTGLKGEEAEVFFEMIDKEYQKLHRDCYFSDDVDGNETGFTRDTKVCLLCAIKVKNVLQAFGVDIENPKVPGKMLH